MTSRCLRGRAFIYRSPMRFSDRLFRYAAAFNVDSIALRLFIVAFHEEQPLVVLASSGSDQE
jgi:hypothetical protein